MTTHNLKQAGILSLFLLAVMFWYISVKQTANVEILQQENFNLVWNDMVDENLDMERMTTANVNVADSLDFEHVSSQAHHIKYPPIYPKTGDTMCAYVRNDTIFVEYYNQNQKNKFTYLHNQ